MKMTRRQVLRGAGAAGLLGIAGCSLLGRESSEGKLIVRQENPFNAEPPLEHLADSFLTPIRSFYVRGHGTLPDVDASGYGLVVEGLVDRPLRLSLDELKSFPPASVAATLECAGNRRAEHSRTKTVGGVQWDVGAIGTAQWKGIRLSEVLHRAGLRPAASSVWFEGLDTITLKDRKTPFGGELPLEKALRPETILAFEMNGETLPREHGYPVRSIAPGFIGARSVKWLGKIVVSDRPSENNFVARDYKLFPPEATPETVKPQEYEPIFGYTLNSAICRPLAGQTLPAGRVQVSGYAIAPAGAALEGVQVSADGGSTWVEARLMTNDAPFTWRLWTAQVDLAAGPRTLTVRAKDTKSGMQPERSPWNFKGYLYTGWHRIPVSVA